MLLLPKLINFALLTVNRFHIDESHGVSHALDVLHHSHNILESELPNHPYLETQRNIVYTSALMHDLCDKKYMNETTGVQNIDTFLQTNTTLTTDEIQVVDKIISTMSYSKVKTKGYPDLGKYQMAYHIVREADLLSAYDVDRSIIYNMNNVVVDFSSSLENALSLFEVRMFKHNEDNLFVTEYSKKLSLQLEKKALDRIRIWKILSNEP
jgi:HD superfamily phosphodiesterase